MVKHNGDNYDDFVKAVKESLDGEERSFLAIYDDGENYKTELFMAAEEPKERFAALAGLVMVAIEAYLQAFDLSNIPGPANMHYAKLLSMLFKHCSETMNITARFLPTDYVKAETELVKQLLANEETPGKKPS